MALNLHEIYKDLHQNPELSLQEFRTAGIVAGHLRDLGFEVHTEIAVTGVVGVLENGDGPVVMLRADMDGLPVLEETGLPYASKARGIDPDGNDVPVMHACGHDVHVTALLGAAEELASTTDDWAGTLIVVFQPSEELGSGAQLMVEDGLYDIVPKPEIVLGQHVTPLPAGVIAVRQGAAMAGADTIDITMFGAGGHGSRPETTVDPIMMAANLAVRLQQVVSREIGFQENAVVTIGQIHGGLKNNIIPSTAKLGLSVRTFDPELRERVLGAIERLANAEAEAAGAPKPPLVEYIETVPVTYNDPESTARMAGAVSETLGYEVHEMPMLSGSEDVGVLAAAAGAPLVYWFLGGFNHALFADAAPGEMPTSVPSNHSGFFGPDMEPTLSAGVNALTAAAREWLN